MPAQRCYVEDIALSVGLHLISSAEGFQRAYLRSDALIPFSFWVLSPPRQYMNNKYSS